MIQFRRRNSICGQYKPLFGLIESIVVPFVVSRWEFKELKKNGWKMMEIPSLWMCYCFWQKHSIRIYCSQISTIFTARIRSVREGNVFSRVCLSVSLSVQLYPRGVVPCDLFLWCTGGTPPPGRTSWEGLLEGCGGRRAQVPHPQEGPAWKDPGKEGPGIPTPRRTSCKGTAPPPLNWTSWDGLP